MARIPSEEIERVKREVSLIEWMGRQGIELTRVGEDNFMGRCPHHDDDTPSLCVSPSKNLWHCLGACNEGGDIIEWVMRAERCGFRRAVEILVGGASEEIKPLLFDDDDRSVKDVVTSYYHERLRAPGSPEGLAYLEHRGIRSDELIERFRIGFGDRSLGGRVPPKESKAGKPLRERLARIGFFREATGREHFNGCVTFPVFDAAGEVAEVYGRKIRDDIRHKHGSHLYLPGPHRGVWNLDGIRESEGAVIVCEALIDAATFWCAGFRNVTSAYGTNGFTSEMLETFKTHAVTRVVIAYDRDEAGDRAAGQLALTLGREGIGAWRVVFPRLMDANDYARKVRPAPHSLGVLLKAAEWMGGAKQRAVSGPIPAALLVRDGERRPSPPAIEARTAKDDDRAADSSSGAMSAHESEPVIEAAKVISSLAAGSVEVSQEVTPTPLAAPDRSLAVSDYSTIDLTFGERRYRVRGFDKNLSPTQMKLVLRVARGELYFLDTLDLVAARHRSAYIKQAAIDLGVKDEVIKRDIASLYRELEQLQEEMIRKTLEPKAGRPAMAEQDLEAAMELARDPKMFERLLSDFERCGMVGERTNKLVLFLGAVSRLLENPVAILIQSSSAAGKTKLMDGMLEMMPEEERERYSAMTGQSLFYFEGKSLKHKILAISEEEGATRASYALKLLQSEGELTIASTGKNPATGRLETQEYHVEGPVMIILTTTAVEIDEELRNRCIVLTVDEDRAQTRAIHELQRRAETLEGMLAREDRSAVQRLWQNFQRILRPVRVVNPHAHRLRFPDGSTRMRRDHTKYLALIRSIALCRQHQRERKIYRHGSGPIEYIEVTSGDIALANELAHEVLGRSLDELAPQTRRLLEVLDREVLGECAKRAMARCDSRFTQRQVREWSGWPDYQVKLHLRKLVDLEYLLVHRGGRGQSWVYELVYDGKGRDGRPFLMGLIDVATLDHPANRDSAKPGWDSEKRQWDSPETAQGYIGDSPGTATENSGKASPEAVFPKAEVKKVKNTHRSGNGKDASYLETDVVANKPHNSQLTTHNSQRPRGEV